MDCTDNPGANYPPVKVCSKDPPYRFEQKHEHPDDLRKIIEDLNVLNQTLLIFASDNGPWSSKCDLTGSQALSAGDGAGGVIKPESVFEAIGSNLEMIPTVAHLAGFSLPSNRTFDSSNQGYDFLFHTDEFGVLSTILYNQYKAYYTTYSAIDGACGGKEGLIIDHKPPLIFDLSRDLTESMPIKVSQSIYDAIDQALQTKLNDIETTLHVNVDYRIGGFDTRVCRCNDYFLSIVDLFLLYKR
ncbi:unnamed protein product [Adineta ricciae]|nr:unnamed protein product [Adineta ricciae]